ncbi:MAG: hypothetical protein BWK75_07020, partial [Candidatus Altiarchaeales archaeon A3]
YQLFRNNSIIKYIIEYREILLEISEKFKTMHRYVLLKFYGGFHNKNCNYSEGTKITKNCGFLIFKNLLDFKITCENSKKYKKSKILPMIFGVVG